MSRMMRKQVYITAQQDALLKRGAKALGVSEADVARRGSELASRAGARVTPDRAPWRTPKAGESCDSHGSRWLHRRRLAGVAVTH